MVAARCAAHVLRMAEGEQAGREVLLDDPDKAWRDLAASSSNEPPALAIRKADGQRINEYCPRITSASMRNSTSLPSLDSTPLLNSSPVGNGLLLGLGHLLDAGGCERRGSRAT